MPDAVFVKDMVTPTPYPGMKQKPVFVQPNTTAFTQRKLIGFTMSDKEVIVKLELCKQHEIRKSRRLHRNHKTA